MGRPLHRGARGWHALTCGIAAFALVLQLALVLEGGQHLGETLPGIESVGRPDVWTRLIRFFSFLTIWFNLLVAGTCAVLVRDPEHDGRIWRVLRLNALVIAVVGGIVHWLLLRPLLNLDGANYLADKLLHIAVPLLTAIGWIMFGPRGRIDRRDLAAFSILPVMWLAYTLVRGAVVGWYPYPFVDVSRLGYMTVLPTALAIGASMLALALVALWLDRRLPDADERRRRQFAA